MRVKPSGPTPSIRLETRRSLQFRFARYGTSGGSVAARRPPRPAGCPSAAQGRRRRPRWRPCPPGRPARVGCRSAARSTAAATLVITTTRERRERNRPQASPAIAYSQPIGLAGRRSVRTSPTVASRARTTAMVAVPDETVGMSRPAEPAANSQDNRLLVGLASFKEAKRGGQVGVVTDQGSGLFGPNPGDVPRRGVSGSVRGQRRESMPA
jgi:hypothetical protein